MVTAWPLLALPRRTIPRTQGLLAIGSGCGDIPIGSRLGTRGAGAEFSLDEPMPRPNNSLVLVGRHRRVVVQSPPRNRLLRR
jgi:hypothetical protein